VHVGTILAAPGFARQIEYSSRDWRATVATIVIGDIALITLISYLLGALARR
jgi:hypothetical protein